MSGNPKLDYEDIVSIDKRIQSLNNEATHFNKIIKHYESYRKMLSEKPDMTFLEYIYSQRDSVIEERASLIKRRKEIIERYQNMEEISHG